MYVHVCMELCMFSSMVLVTCILSTLRKWMLMYPVYKDIVEIRFLKLLKYDVCVTNLYNGVLFRRVNKQPEIHNFEIYADIAIKISYR